MDPQQPNISIQQGAHLRHVEVEHDASKPVIDPDAHVQPSQRKDMLQEVKAAAHKRELVHNIKDGALPELRHVEVAHDGSVPAIPADAHVNTWPKEEFLKEVGSPHKLRHVADEQIHDSSRPVISPDAHIKPNHHKELLQELKQAVSGELPPQQ